MSDELPTVPLSTMTLPAGHLAYRDLGDGPPVVLLHGGALDHRLWQPQLAPLAESYRVIAVDFRGHGASATPHEPFRHCDDLAVLLGELAVGPATLVGISLGAGVAVDTAVAYPDLVSGVVISGAGTSDPDFRDPWLLARMAAWTEAGRRGDTETWLAEFLTMAVGPRRSADDVDADVLALVHEMAAHTVATHVGKGEPVVGGPVEGIREKAPQLTVPLHAILGMADADDHIRMPRELAGAVSRGTVTEILNAAHYPNLEWPTVFAGEVLDFLAEHAVR